MNLDDCPPFPHLFYPFFTFPCSSLFHSSCPGNSCHSKPRRRSFFFSAFVHYTPFRHCFFLQIVFKTVCVCRSRVILELSLSRLSLVLHFTFLSLPTTYVLLPDSLHHRQNRQFLTVLTISAFYLFLISANPYPPPQSTPECRSHSDTLHIYFNPSRWSRPALSAQLPWPLLASSS